MKRTALIIAAAVMTVSLSSCSSFEGTMSEKVKTFEDDHGRVCTILKWGESASIDCDYPQGPGMP